MSPAPRVDFDPQLSPCYHASRGENLFSPKHIPSRFPSVLIREIRGQNPLPWALRINPTSQTGLVDYISGMQKSHMGKGILLAAVIALVCFCLPRLGWFGSSGRIASTPAVITQVQTLAQLVTVKYVMEKVVILEDVSWMRDLIPGWGDNRVLMVAHGIVKAGVDLSEIRSGDIQISKDKIVVKLPPPRITDAYLDDKHTTIVERDTGLLRHFDKDLEQNARRQAVADINRAAREGGILKDADERARALLTSLFHQMGFARVEFRAE